MEWVRFAGYCLRGLVVLIPESPPEGYQHRQMEVDTGLMKASILAANI